MHPPEDSNLRVLKFDKEDGGIKSTMYDVSHQGKTYNIKVDACDKGFKISYLTLVKKIDHTPAPFRAMVDPTETAYYIAREEHVHEPKWYRQTFGDTLEKAAVRTLKKMKREFERSIRLADRADSFNMTILEH